MTQLNIIEDESTESTESTKSTENAESYKENTYSMSEIHRILTESVESTENAKSYKKTHRKRKLNRLFTERELYQITLPVPKLIKIKFQTTESASRRVPNDPVRLWKDFLVGAFNTSSSLDASNHRFERPDIEKYGLSVEDSVVDSFLETMRQINNQRLLTLPRPERWGKYYLFSRIKGQPDAIRCGADTRQLLVETTEASQLLTTVEIKPDQLLKEVLGDNNLNLHEAYNIAMTVIDDGTTRYTIHQKIIRIVRQTFGYMVVNDLKYGILTTYIRTWFFCRDRDDPNILYISPAVHINQKHTLTQASFLECMYYLETLSTNEQTAHSSPPADSGDDGNNRENKKNSRKRKRLED